MRSSRQSRATGIVMHEDRPHGQRILHGAERRSEMDLPVNGYYPSFTHFSIHPQLHTCGSSKQLNSIVARPTLHMSSSIVAMAIYSCSYNSSEPPANVWANAFACALIPDRHAS